MFRFNAMLLIVLLLFGCSTSTTPIANPGSKPAAVGFSVGNSAPDIEGSDLDDQAFKLSDYRGKVVMLDFWGDW